MMENIKLLIPPNIVKVDAPIIFLGGPIQGAENWREEAIDIIHHLNPNICIASPYRDKFDESFVYEEQVDWETHYLNEASRNGVVLFWLTKEKNHNCERPFAQTTRFEIAEWKVKHERDGAKIAIGIEEGFSNSRYIRRRFSQDCPDIKIGDSLEETCKMAVKLLEK